MSMQMYQGLVWACFCFFVGGMFFCVGCMQLWLCHEAGYERGKRDALPPRARNGWFVGRPK